MAKFDLDDLLKDLGDGGEGAPEPTPADGEDATSAIVPAKPSTEGRLVRSGSTPLAKGKEEGGEGGALAKKGPRIRPDDALAHIFEPEAAAAAQSLGEFLVERGIISNQQLANAERVIKQTPGRRLAQVLVEMGADEAHIQAAVAAISRLPFQRVDPEDHESFDLKSINKLGPEYCKTNYVMPLRREGSRLLVGTVNPDDVFRLDDVKRRLGVPAVKHVLVTSQDIFAVVDSLNEQVEADEFDVDDILADVDEDDVEVLRQDEEEDDDGSDSSPVVRYVNHIIQTALKEGASDIHIEPDEKKLKVRFRIDGVLFEMMNPPRKMHASLTSRVKIMANLDIAERRLPQDGRIRATVLGRKIDLRVSTVPTAKGEKTVMRILDNRSISVGLDELGFADDTLTIWKNQIANPHGILLVTGPTGSGKTTTLYSSIRQMDLQKQNISTVEDPVEYNLAGITQIQTHERIGMTFGVALKALLRQDPDVVMLGEIRDMETATIAIQAAMTGHLVLSTLHTNDAPSSITRLINIGIEPFLVGAACNAVLAQRLVRRICPNCRIESPAREDIAEFLAVHGVDATKLSEGTGCNKCRETGYSGRNGLYELLVMDDHMRDSVARNPNVTEFRRVCKERGMISLREDGFRKVAEGKTTVEEILRVTESTI